MASNKKNASANEAIKAPNLLLYAFVWLLAWSLSKLFFFARYERSKTLKKHQGPLIFIGNHGSYLDVLFALVGAGRKRMHFVAGDFVFNKKTNWILNKLRLIPKKQFYPDVKTVRSFFRVLNEGRRVFIYPEGQRSINGRAGRLDPLFSRLVKKSEAAVAIVECHGSYLAWPRWATGLFRPGRVYVSSRILLRADEVKFMELDEIHAHIKEALQISDYDFQLTRKKPGKYLTTRPADGLQNILHHCPSCKRMQAMESGGRNLYCRYCSWEIRLGLDGFFEPTGAKPFFPRPDQWHSWQQEELAALFKQDPNYTLSFPAKMLAKNNPAPLLLAGQVDLSAEDLTFISNDDSEGKKRLIFPRAGQKDGIFAHYGSDFRQFSSECVWDFYPDQTSGPIIVHDWVMMNL